ncbi:SRPBCC family protein [Gordonia sp. VNK1]|uniref:SRPBCC family protein n=1 Tax=Gordonia oleivorans TaxID=3156618 RepID=UPI0032B41F44
MAVVVTARSQIASVRVDIDAPVDVAFGYLTDPDHRPEWQSSLSRIDDVVAMGSRPGDVGSSWRDITRVPLVRPAMEVVTNEPCRRWAEIGRWGPVDAELVLEFASPAEDRTSVTATAVMTVPTVAAPTLYVLRLITPAALRSDLKRAAALLKSRTTTP